MNFFVSYVDFLKNKDNIREYLDSLFIAVPDIIVYFPDNLSKEDRNLIYTHSKGYLFDKLHNVSSDYSIKLWKPLENNNEISEEYDNISSEQEQKQEEEEEEEEEEQQEEEQQEDYEEEDYEEGDYEEEDYEDYEYYEEKIVTLEDKINILINKFNIVNLTCVFNILLLFYVILLNPIRVIVTKEEHNECNFKMIA
jgi:hypothetical protein